MPPAPNFCSVAVNVVKLHHHGWYTGSGVRKNGSTVPNATETTT